jgi:hypothetical protein
MDFPCLRKGKARLRHFEQREKTCEARPALQRIARKPAPPGREGAARAEDRLAVAPPGDTGHAGEPIRADDEVEFGRQRGLHRLCLELLPLPLGRPLRRGDGQHDRRGTQTTAQLRGRAEETGLKRPALMQDQQARQRLALVRTQQGRGRGTSGGSGAEGPAQKWPLFVSENEQVRRTTNVVRSPDPQWAMQVAGPVQGVGKDRPLGGRRVDPDDDGLE